jgi:hypothetical protein
MFRIPTWLVFLVFVGTGAVLFALSGFRTEGFQPGFVPGRPSMFCDADHICPNGKRCFNGQCATVVQPVLPANELPVLPIGYINGRL